MSWEPGSLCFHKIRDQKGNCLDCGERTGEPGDLSLLTRRERAEYEWSLVKLNLRGVLHPPVPKTSKLYGKYVLECRADAYPHLVCWAELRRLERKKDEHRSAA